MIVTEYRAQEGLRRVGVMALVGALIGLVLLTLGALVGNPEQFWRSYYIAWLYWTGICLGSLGLLMIQHVSGGIWGATLRRMLESAALTLPWMALFFVPVALFGMHHVFEWSHEGFMVGDVLEQKANYLNVPFFLGRMAAYFIIWTVLVLFLTRWSRRLDSTGDMRFRGKMLGLSAPGLLIYAVTMTLATVDMVLSLDAEFYSTIWGALVTFSFILAAFSLMIVVLSLLTDSGPLRHVMSTEHFLDLGTLMLAFTILWTYFSFSQFIIIWSGNLPQEAVWYTVRLESGWGWIGLALLLFAFSLPFLLLLSRPLKENYRSLVVVAAIVAFMQYVNLYYLSVPSWHRDGLHISWMDFAAPIGFGGVWLLIFSALLRGRPLLPLYVLPERHPRDHRELNDGGH
ncbi:MAG: hypothetical protein M3506_08060 [Chloroflexota bacterium]|nr:hypothetical protein [Chloroflexota bacterium]